MNRVSCVSIHKVKEPTGKPTCPAEVQYAKQVFRKIEERPDASGEVDHADLWIEEGNNVNDEFMEIEDSQENDDATQMSETYAAISSDFIGATPAVSAGETSARFTTSTRFPCPMVSPRLRDEPESNNLEKKLALVSTRTIASKSELE